MRLLKLKPARLALVLSIFTLTFHLGTGYLLAAVIKNQMLASLWQHSLSLYWPAVALVQIVGLNVNVGVFVGMGMMILAALLQWWVIFSTGIWVARSYFQKPPISNVSRISIAVIVMLVAVCFYEINPETLGLLGGEEPLERALALGDTRAVEKILKSKPALANKPFRFSQETPYFSRQSAAIRKQI
jgi:hypothetical protein